jgi:hypothetical protein
MTGPVKMFCACRDQRNWHDVAYRGKYNRCGSASARVKAPASRCQAVVSEAKKMLKASEDKLACFAITLIASAIPR